MSQRNIVNVAPNDDVSIDAKALRTLNLSPLQLLYISLLYAADRAAQEVVATTSQ